MRNRKAVLLSALALVGGGTVVADACLCITPGPQGQSGGGEDPPPEPPPAGEAQLWIDTDGGTCTRDADGAEYATAAACDTFLEAYQRAQQGDLVLVKAGSYPEETMSGSSNVKGDPDEDETDVTFRAASGETVLVAQLVIRLPHMTFDDIDFTKFSIDYYSNDTNIRAGDITIQDSDVGVGDVTSAFNVVLDNMDFGPNEGVPSNTYPYPQDTLIINANPVDDGHHPTGVVLSDSVIHDVTRPTVASHSDCLQITAGEDITVERNHFYNCADTNFIPKNDQGPILDLTIQNNWLDEVVNASEGINLFDTTSRECGTVLIRHNTVLDTIRTDAAEECELTVIGNIVQSFSSTRCSNDTSDTYDFNVHITGVQCGGNNVLVADGDADFVDGTPNSATQDLHLETGSEAIDAGSTGNFPATDKDGTSRYLGAAPDAGAHEKE